MEAKRIRKALAKYLNTESDVILLEVFDGNPRTPQGGTWIEVEVSKLEAITEGKMVDPDTNLPISFDRDKSGYGKYLDKWFAEALITAKERDIGKT